MGSANLTPRQLEILIAVVAEMKQGEVSSIPTEINGRITAKVQSTDQLGGRRSKGQLQLRQVRSRSVRRHPQAPSGRLRQRFG